MTTENQSNETAATSGVDSSDLLDFCTRVEGKKLVRLVGIVPEYKKSLPMISCLNLGALTRTGICSRCDAAIYSDRIDNMYHAVSGGLIFLYSSRDESVRRCERCGRAMPSDTPPSVYGCTAGSGCADYSLQNSPVLARSEAES